MKKRSIRSPLALNIVPGPSDFNCSAYSNNPFHINKWKIFEDIILLCIPTFYQALWF
jgi:hypothetical protein